MFFNKNQKEASAEAMCDPFKDKVKCEECKHYVDKIDAQKITQITSLFYGNSTKYYCPLHKKPYSKINLLGYPAAYYREMQVDENGTPIGYVKKSK